MLSIVKADVRPVEEVLSCSVLKDIMAVVETVIRTIFYLLDFTYSLA